MLAYRALILPALCLAAVAATGCAQFRVDKAARAATGFAAHTLCDDLFITGADEQTAYAERVESLPGMGLVSWAMRHKVDRARQAVTVSVGPWVSKARLHPQHGCQVETADGQQAAAPAAEPSPGPTTPQPPDPWGPNPMRAANPALRAILDAAVHDEPGRPPHRTKAALVLHEGRLLGEAYAPGYGVETAILGFSTTKSVTHALIGILVRQGRLRHQAPGVVPAWRDPQDPRQAITAELLLRQTAGLDLLQDNSGFDANAQIMYTAGDKAAAVAAAPLAHAPGTHWAYTDANYVLLSRLIRDAAGGHAEDVRQLVQQDLAEPLGLRHMRFDFDATGSPVGSSHLLASARDWARFGQLYLDDGFVGGRRILPEGWVAMARTPTLDTGYGAGWWTNRKPGLVPGWGTPWGLPAAPEDTFFARGFMGNFVVVVPSRRLVLVRLSVSTQRGDDIEETNRLVSEVLQALPG